MINLTCNSPKVSLSTLYPSILREVVENAAAAVVVPIHLGVVATTVRSVAGRREESCISIFNSATGFILINFIALKLTHTQTFNFLGFYKNKHFLFRQNKKVYIIFTIGFIYNLSGLP